MNLLFVQLQSWRNNRKPSAMIPETNGSQNVGDSYSLNLTRSNHLFGPQLADIWLDQVLLPLFITIIAYSDKVAGWMNKPKIPFSFDSPHNCQPLDWMRSSRAEVTRTFDSLFSFRVWIFGRFNTSLGRSYRMNDDRWIGLHQSPNTTDSTACTRAPIKVSTFGLSRVL